MLYGVMNEAALQNDDAVKVIVNVMDEKNMNMNYVPGDSSPGVQESQEQSHVTGFHKSSFQIGHENPYQSVG